MAVAYVNNGGLVSAATGSITPTLPGSRINGNLLLGIAYLAGTSSSSIVWPAGWTVNQNQAWGTGQATIAWRVVDGTETAPNITSVSGPWLLAEILQYSGVSTTSPIGATSYNTAASGTHTCPAITTTANNSLAVLIDLAGNSGSLTTPSGWTLDTAQTSVETVTCLEMAVASSGTSTGAVSTAGVNTTYGMFQLELKLSPNVTTSLTGVSGTGSIGSIGGPPLVLPITGTSGVGVLGIIGTAWPITSAVSVTALGTIQRYYPFLPVNSVTSIGSLKPYVGYSFGSTVNISSMMVATGKSSIVFGSTANASSVISGGRRILATMNSSVNASSGEVPHASIHLSISSAAQISSGMSIATAYSMAWVYNVNTEGTSIYDGGFKFNSFASFGNKFYGCGAGGIYLLEGDTDAGSPINAVITLPLSALPSEYDPHQFEMAKTVQMSYVDCQSSAALQLNMNTDQGINSYVFQNTSPTNTNVRVKCAEGVRAVRWQPEFVNTGGGAFRINSISLEFRVFTRRVFV